MQHWLVWNRRPAERIRTGCGIILFIMKQIHTVTLNPVIDLIYQVESFEKGTTFRCGLFDKIPAGKGVNVSYALRHLGERSHAHVLLGENELALFRDRFDRLGIHFHPYPGSFSTREHCTILESSTGSVTHVQTTGVRIPDSLLAAADEGLQKSIHPGDLLVLSGSIPPGIPASVYGDWIKTFQSRQVTIILDASGEALIHGAKASPTVVKLNQLEAEQLTGIPLTTEKQELEALRQLLDTTDIPIVVISLGSRGVIASDRSSIWSMGVPLSKHEVKDTVGCGDTMVAGIAAALKQNEPLKPMLRFAVASASAAAIHAGPAQFHSDDIERMLPRVQIERIA